MPSNINFAMLTDPGLVRASNQDACAADPEAGIYVVCDGMGGAAGGEIASRLAADTFLDFYATQPQGAMRDAVIAANEAVHQRSVEDYELNGMGTTLVSLVLNPGPESPSEEDKASTAVGITHVGDSRAYLWREGQLHRLTDDHSLVEEQVRAGYLTPEQALTAPYRNIITRAIGSAAHVEPAVATCSTQPGDLFLLASDGLTRDLGNEEVAAQLAKHDSTDLLATCHALVDAANEAGGGDNITVLLVHIG